MCKIHLKKPLKEKTLKVTQWLINLLDSLYHFASRYRYATLSLFIAVLAVCAVRFCFWGTEFIPSMNEGAIYVRATLPNSISLDESVRITKEMKSKLQNFDEVDCILTQTGRPNDGTNDKGFFNIEVHTELTQVKKLTRKISIDDLYAQIEGPVNIDHGILLASILRIT